MITKYVAETNQSKCSESVKHIKLREWREKAFIFYKLEIENMGLNIFKKLRRIV